MSQRRRGPTPNNTHDIPSGQVVEDYDLTGSENRLWNLAPKGPTSFKSGDELWFAAVQYFEWATNNPLYEVKAFAYEGVVQLKEIPKMRAFTLQGLCMFIGISRMTFFRYIEGREGTGGGHPDLQEAARKIDEIIREQKFTGAAADLLNSSIIARDLGLVDKTESKVTLEDERTPDQIAASIESKLAGIAARYRQDPLL